MKKLIGVVILGLLLSGNVMAANLKPLVQYGKEIENQLQKI